MITEAARLARYRDMILAVEPGDWSRVHDEVGPFLEARTEQGEMLPIARFHEGATEDEIGFVVEAPRITRFLLGLVDRAIASARAARPAAPADQPNDAAKDFAAECAMKCAEPAFKTFLEAEHGLERPLTDDRVAQKVRSLLGVTSRAELNDGGAAAARWKDLRSAFDAWKRAGR